MSCLIANHVADHDFQAVGPALHILQLNVEGLSPAKRSIIQNGGLSQLHSADDAAIAWLTNYGS